MDFEIVGTGDCDGAVNGSNGKPIKIPCDCPPDRESFVQVSPPFSSLTFSILTTFARN